MCGIVGIFAHPDTPVPTDAIARMSERLAHRGPDSASTLAIPGTGVQFGHTRLAIIDLSPAGAQPMTSACGRFTIVINGEVYNFNNLRRDLNAEASIAWRGHSDTEVLLEAVARWGFEATIKRCEGMFALAIWDRKNSRLLLARDRFGEKPLYVARHGGILLFASELGAIMNFPGFEGLPDERARALFLSLSYIPEPLTPFSNVTKMPAGCLAALPDPAAELEPKVYWDPARAAREARAEAPRDSCDARQAVEERFSQVIANQMIADVPVGVFLSGGLDSSVVAAVMQEQSKTPVNSFTIGFAEKDYNEADHARAIARHLGTHHTEVMLDWRDALDLISTLPHVYSEPFGDSSQLPSILISQVARRSVTVALTGDGGDEVFAGYNRHVFGWHRQRITNRVLWPLLRPLGKVLRAIGQPGNAGVLSRLSALAGKRGITLPAEKLGKLAAIIDADDDLELYAGLVRRDEGLIVDPDLSLHLKEQAETLHGDGLSLPEFMMLLDAKTYLSGDILHKVDRASMSVSLETRAPYLDHKLFELARAIPIGEHLAGGRSKVLLRSMLSRRVPDELFNRPKAGFGVPIDSWLRGPLREWMEEMVRAYRAAHPDHAQAVGEAQERFLEGKGHLHHFIWNVAMWQAWADGQVCDVAPARDLNEARAARGILS